MTQITPLEPMQTLAPDMNVLLTVYRRPAATGGFMYRGRQIPTFPYQTYGCVGQPTPEEIQALLPDDYDSHFIQERQGSSWVKTFNSDDRRQRLASWGPDGQPMGDAWIPERFRSHKEHA